MDLSHKHLVLTALFEEYQAMYGLVEFRMSALDRRVPVTAAAFVGAIVSLQVVPAASQVILLVSLPVALFWFMRATVNHARSFEDVLRRIEEIEQKANELLGADVLRFQSRHPSRHRHVGGRTGRASVLAVLATVFVLLASAAFQATGEYSSFSDWQTLYIGFLAIDAIACCHEVVRLSQYVYIPNVDLRRGIGD